LLAVAVRGKHVFALDDGFCFGLNYREVIVDLQREIQGF
jgi:hypothetical protein